MRSHGKHHWHWALVMLSLGGCGTSDDFVDGAPVARQMAEVAPPVAASGKTDALEDAFRSFPPEGFCDSRWCWVDPRPTNVRFQKIGGASEDDLWIGSETGPLLHWDGVTLRTVPTTIGGLAAIEATAPDDVWIAGYNKLDHWNGREFTSHNLKASTIWRADADHLYAGVTGSFGALYTWTGSAFQNIANIQQASCFAGTGPNDLWAGTSNGLVHYEGERWNQVDALRGHNVMQVAAFAPNDVWVVTNQLGDVRVVHFDGTSWTQRYATRSYIHSIVGSGSSDLWLLSSSEAVHYDGSSFTAVPGYPGSSAAGDVAGTIYAVGDRGTVLRLAASPTPSVHVISRTEPKMKAVWASARTDVWAAGQQGAAWNFDGKTLTPVATGVTVPLNDIGGTGADDVWFVGDQGTVLHGSLATGFRALQSGVTARLLSVYAAARDEVWIGGDGVLLRATQTTIEPVAVPGLGNRSVVDIHGLGRDDVWAIAGGYATHFDGSAWSTSQAIAPAKRIWALSANDVWAVSDSCGHGSCYTSHWDGRTWTSTMASPSPATWMIPMHYDAGYGRSMISWALGPDDLWSVTSQGAVLRKVRR